MCACVALIERDGEDRKEKGGYTTDTWDNGSAASSFDNPGQCQAVAQHTPHPSLSGLLCPPLLPRFLAALHALCLSFLLSPHSKHNYRRPFCSLEQNVGHLGAIWMLQWWECFKMDLNPKQFQWSLLPPSSLHEVLQHSLKGITMLGLFAVSPFIPARLSLPLVPCDLCLSGK